MTDDKLKTTGSGSTSIQDNDIERNSFKTHATPDSCVSIYDDMDSEMVLEGLTDRRRVED